MKTINIKEKINDTAITALATVAIATAAIGLACFCTQEGHVYSDNFADKVEEWNQEWVQEKGDTQCFEYEYKAFIMPKINEYFGIETEETNED